MNEGLPLLLFNDECGVCRRLARWVQASAQGPLGRPTVLVRPIGDDPQVLEALHPGLSIWDAYENLHLLMPDGSVKLDGEAVAELLRNLANSRWFAWTFALNVGGFRPFQWLLNSAYAVLADIRPLLGCESCGTPSAWMRPLVWMRKKAGAWADPGAKPRFSPRRTPPP